VKRNRVAMATILVIAGCSHAPHGVSVDSRPTPKQPAAATTPAAGEGTPGNPAPTVGDATSASERQVRMRRIVADTSAVNAAMRRCAGRRLLPDQETTLESTRGLMAQTRAALARDELWRAESLARKAHQLAGALDCP
jgi:hypothetical protein